LGALLDHLDIKRAYLAGHSFGGAAALHLAVLQPQRVLGLILADVRIRSVQPAQGAHNWPHWPALQKKFAESGIQVRDDDPEWELRLLEELARRRLDGSLESLDLGSPFVPFLTSNRERAKQWLKLIGETTAMKDFRADAGLTPKEIQKAIQPTLAVYGEFSHCLPSLRALVTLLPNCHSVLVKGVGHFHPLLKPQLFLRHTRRFLRQLSLLR
jgi:pimeloyl-ACP methyl ester carboxylesterase